MSRPGIFIDGGADLTINRHREVNGHGGQPVWVIRIDQLIFIKPWELLIFHPLATSTDYCRFGHSLRSITWMLKQHEPLLPVFPFCNIKSFDVIWRSEQDDNGLSCYFLKPIPICTDYYKTLRYCFHRGIDPRPDMTKEPRNLSFAVKFSLLEAVPYKAELR